VPQAKNNAQLKFMKSRRVEREYARQLRSVAKQIDQIVRGFAPKGHVDDEAALQLALRKYAETIRPWAKAVGARMVADIARRDRAMWFEMAEQTGRDLKRLIDGAPIGVAMRQSLDAQVELITSLPLDAAKRVHELTLEGIVNSTRAKEIAAEILKTGEVTASRATLIARTEVGRTATALTHARSNAAGVTHYIWRTSGDSDVRESHRKMNGQVVPWATPPTLSDGTVTHAGAIYNCRCYPEPIIPEDYQ
jgi:SPP1 gp7 family putative phage head morphogenesis protein